MKIILSLILLLTAGIAVSQEDSSKNNPSNEDKAASRLIRKKRERIRSTTETVKQTPKESGKKADE